MPKQFIDEDEIVDKIRSVLCYVDICESIYHEIKHEPNYTVITHHPLANLPSLFYLMSTMSIGDRMKSYEDTYDIRVCDVTGRDESGTPTSSPCIVRVDGHCFSKWTKGFDKPFDHGLHETFCLTCEDLLCHFNEAKTVYTQSDEITLLFPDGIRMFGGRVQKIVTLVASYTTARFNHHLVKTLPNVPENKAGFACFDARVFEVPSREELLNNILWRSRTDCRRNSVFQYSRQFFSARQMMGVNTKDQIAMVQDTFGDEYETSVPAWAKHGTTLKKSLVELEGKNPTTGNVEKCSRTVVKRKYVEYDRFSGDLLDMLTAKYEQVK